jgi:hypothetical protein
MGILFIWECVLRRQALMKPSTFMPDCWLTGGLPHLAEWIKWLQGFIAEDLKGGYSQEEEYQEEHT